MRPGPYGCDNGESVSVNGMLPKKNLLSLF